jgi:acetyl-CoA carboxylase alpha subunit
VIATQDPETATILFKSTENFLKSAEEKKSTDDVLSHLEVMQQVIEQVARHMEDRSKLEEITVGYVEEALSCV